MAKIEQDIKSILGEISEVDSKNEQKVVAIASWNGRDDKIEIRKYNVSDEILLKGIGLTPDEAAELLYILLSNPSEINYDRERVYQILKEQEEKEIDVQELVSNLPVDGIGDMPDLVDSDDYNSEVVYANAVHKAHKSNIRRIVLKKNGLFSHLY